jgi:hypothetical protein
MMDQFIDQGLEEENLDSKVKIIDIGELSPEEKDLVKCLDVLKFIKSKYTIHEVINHVHVLSKVTKLQGLTPEFRKSALRELRTLKVVKDIVNFDW